MPKMKSNSGAKKRFKWRGEGIIRRKHAFKTHNLQYQKSKKQKRRLTKMGFVSKVDQAKVRQLLIYKV